MIEWFIKNPVAANLFMLFIIMSGLASIPHLSLQTFPDKPVSSLNITIPVSVQTALEAENMVALPIENSLKNITGIKMINTISDNEKVSVSINMDTRIDPQITINNIKEKMSKISELPIGISIPELKTNTFSEKVLTIMINTDLETSDLNAYVNDLKNEIIKLNNVDAIDLLGIIEPELDINVRYDWINHYGLKRDVVEQALRNIQTKPISIGTGKKNLTTNDIGLLHEMIIHNYGDGRYIKLGDIAKISIVDQPNHITKVRFNGKPAAAIDILRSDRGNALEISNLVTDFLDQYKPDSYKNFNTTIIDNQTRLLEDRLGILVENALMGSLLLFLILAIFLHISIAFWVFVGIFVSFVGALTFMNIADISINSFSLFGFIVALGLVVDDAIVTSESIHYYARPYAGLTITEAAILGTKKVSGPVTFSMLSTVVAMIPLMYIDSPFQHYFKQIPIVLVPILLVSLIESKLILPSHLKHLKESSKTEEKKGFFYSVKEGFTLLLGKLISNYYVKIFDWSIDNRYLVSVIIISVFVIICSLFINGWIRFSSFEEVSDPEVTASIFSLVIDDDTSETINRVVNDLEASASHLQNLYSERYNFPIVENIVTEIALRSGHVVLKLAPKEQYEQFITLSQIRSDWYQQIENVPQELIVSINDFQSGATRSSLNKDSSFKKLYVSFLSDNRHDIALARDEFIKFYKYNSQYKIEPNDLISFQESITEFSLKPLAHILNISRSSIHQQIVDFISPSRTIIMNFGDKDVTGRINWSGIGDHEKSDLVRLYIKDDHGHEYPLENLVKWESNNIPNTIFRQDFQASDSIELSYDSNQFQPVFVVKDINEYLDNLKKRYPTVRMSASGFGAGLSSAVKSTLSLTAIVFLIIYLLLAIPLKSYIQPIAILSVLPFCFIGALIGHVLLGIQFGLLSLLGVVASLGVAVNDCLIFVHELNYINNLNETKGLSKDGKKIDFKSILRRTGQARFKVVFITSVSTFGSLIPLIFTNTVQGKLLAPMAVSLGFGVIFSLFISLIFLPIIFMISEDCNIFRKSGSVEYQKT